MRSAPIEGNYQQSSYPGRFLSVATFTYLALVEVAKRRLFRSVF